MVVRYSGALIRLIKKLYVALPRDQRTLVSYAREREANELCAGEPKSGDGKARDTSLSARDPRS